MGTYKGDSLEADEVVARRYGSGDGGSPRTVISDHLSSSPRAIVDCSADKTRFLDLEPLQAVRVNTSAGSIAVGKVCQLTICLRTEGWIATDMNLQQVQCCAARSGSSKQ